MGRSSKPNIELLMERLRVDETTGLLHWTDSVLNRKSIRGQRAFTAISTSGYRVSNISGKTLLASHVVFALTHGRWPERVIDHVDRDKLNDRPVNLRESTYTENGRNQLRKHGNSKFKGVHKMAGRRKYKAYATDRNSRPVYLGHFADEVAAAIIHDEFVKREHGEFALLNFPERKKGN